MTTRGLYSVAMAISGPGSFLWALQIQIFLYGHYDRLTVMCELVTENLVS